MTYIGRQFANSIFGDITANSVTVTGNVSGNVVTTNTETVNGALTVNGAVTVNSSITANGNGQFSHIGANSAPDSVAVAKFGGQYFAPLVNKANTTTAMTIDWSAGNEQYANVNASVTFTFSNPVDGGRYVLILKCGSSLTATWPANVLWPSAVAPTLTATVGKYDLLTFTYLATANVYLGAFNQNY